MYLKKFGKITLRLIVILVMYLSIVAAWASLSVDKLLPIAPTESELIQLTPDQKSILLVIEDPTFYEHAGLDLSKGQGLTTITSSLARKLFLFGEELDGIKGGFQSFYRGFFECCKKVDLGRDIMALVLHQNMYKEQQLQLYVSTSYMGTYKGVQVRGLPAAASYYFNKQLAELSRDEFITLVAMLKSPNYYHPTKGPQRLALRVSNIKKLLAKICTPKGWFDTDYEHCSIGREA